MDVSGKELGAGRAPFHERRLPATAWPDDEYDRLARNRTIWSVRLRESELYLTKRFVDS
jgi:hypothetical protein